MINVEIKARSNPNQQAAVRLWLQDQHARHDGTDRQRDTYFRVPRGRLKLREGAIENALIQYDRPEAASPKVSHCTIVPLLPGSNLKEALDNALGVLAVVEKTRDIFWLENVKIHIDWVEGLGYFLEIEAQDSGGTGCEDSLREQCQALMQQFDIQDEDLVKVSYSDMILEKLGPGTTQAGLS